MLKDPKAGFSASVQWNDENGYVNQYGLGRKVGEHSEYLSSAFVTLSIAHLRICQAELGEIAA